MVLFMFLSIRTIMVNMSSLGVWLTFKAQTAVQMWMEKTAFYQSCSLGCESSANSNNKQTAQLFQQK